MSPEGCGCVGAVRRYLRTLAQGPPPDALCSLPSASAGGLALSPLPGLPSEAVAVRRRVVGPAGVAAGLLLVAGAAAGCGAEASTPQPTSSTAEATTSTAQETTTTA